MQKLTSRRKIETLCQMHNLPNIISEPTHFRESSSSLIDLFLVTNKNHILLSGVGELFLDQNIRFHCPIYCVLNLDKTITYEYEREIWLYDKGNYNSLINKFYNSNWDTFKSNDIDIYTSNITKHIINTAKKHIPNKIVKIRQCDPKWLNSNIKRVLRKKKRLYDKFKSTGRIVDHENYKKLQKLCHK